MKALIDKLKNLPDFGRRVRNEPLVLAGLALACLQALMAAQSGGLGTEDTWILVADAAIIWLGRELTVPVAKVKSGEFEIEEFPGEPAIEDVDA